MILALGEIDWPAGAVRASGMPSDPADMGAILRAAVEAHLAAHPGLSQAQVARDAGLDPASLNRAMTRPNAAPRLVRAVCRALGLRVALVAP